MEVCCTTAFGLEARLTTFVSDEGPRSRNDYGGGSQDGVPNDYGGGIVYVVEISGLLRLFHRGGWSRHCLRGGDV